MAVNVTKLLDNVSVPTTAAVIYPQRLNGKNGGKIHFYGNTVGVPSYNVVIKGRLSHEAPYVTIATVTQVGAFDRNTSYTCPLFPEMLIDLTTMSTTSGSYVFSCWLEE